MSILVLLVSHHKPEEEAQSPPSSIVFPRAVQILMPNDLCDNMQSTLQFYFNEFVKTTHPYRQQWHDQITRLREEMRTTGCG